MKQTLLKDIKTPTTVDEFRRNLKLYFFSYGEDCLYVKTDYGSSDGVPYEEIKDLGDLYERGFNPQIIPLIDYDFGKVVEHMCTTGQTLSSNGFFNDDYPVFTKEESFMEQSKLEGLQWFGIDNQILREFLVKVLGDYSGYSLGH